MIRWKRTAAALMAAAMMLAQAPAGVLAAETAVPQDTSVQEDTGLQTDADSQVQKDAEKGVDKAEDPKTENADAGMSGSTTDQQKSDIESDSDKNTNDQSQALPEAGQDAVSSSAEEKTEVKEDVEADPAESLETPIQNTAVEEKEETDIISIPGEFTVNDQASLDLGDADALFEEYANRMFYGSSSAAAPSGKKLLKSKGMTGDRLEGQNRVIYDKVKEAAAEIADGNRESAIVQIPVTDLGLKLSYTTEELGVGKIYENGDWIDENIQKGAAALSSLLTYNLRTFMNALFADCAYEFYWGNGGMGVETGCAYSSNNTFSFSNNCITVNIGVNPTYRKSEKKEDEYNVDTAKTGAVSTAVANAKKIVSNANGMTDYYRLNYYKEQICNLVEYNHDAAAATDYTDRSPWALVYVFDDDESTKVVCEGYSEAFQYLAELSTFNNSSVNVYSVTGTMGGGTGEGAHKWNIVHMDDGKNYIADITNSDEGAAGYDGKLFLKGMEGSVDGGYNKPLGSDNKKISYKYDEETLAIYDRSDLELSSTDYVVSVPQTTDDKASLTGMSIFLTDKIGMEVYVKPADSVTLKDTDQIVFTYGENTVTQNVSDAAWKTIKDYNGDDIKVLEFQLDLRMKQMTDEVKFHMVVDGRAGEDKIYSVRSYADAILRNPAYSNEQKEMVRTMLSCGGYTQQYFDYNTGNLANAGVYDGQQDPGDMNVTIDDSYKYTVKNAEDKKGFHIKQATLALGTDVNLVFYYTLDAGKADTDYDFALTDGSASNKVLEYGYDDAKKMNYVIVPHILPNQLSTMYTLAVTPKNESEAVMTLTYSPYTFMKAKIERDTTAGSKQETLKKLCKSLYAYCNAANKLLNQ